MRTLLLLSSVLITILVSGQDKVYLLNNQVVEGTVTYLGPKLIQVNTKNYDILEYHFNDIAMIVKNGESKVIQHNIKRQKKINKNSWSIGTNICSMLVDAATISIDKRFNQYSSLKFNQIFVFRTRYNYSDYFSSLSSVLVNGYLNGGLLSFIGSAGIGISYNERYYYSSLSHRMQTNAYAYIPIGIGINLDISKHLSMCAQIFTSFNLDQSYYFRYFQGVIDMFNSGFNIYYKF